MKVYSSIKEIEQLVKNSINASYYAGDYDTLSIAQAVSGWYEDTDEDGNIRLDSSGLIILESFEDAESFWNIVEANKF